jgi:hypothetical protein
VRTNVARDKVVSDSCSCEKLGHLLKRKIIEMEGVADLVCGLLRVGKSS